MRGRFFLMNFMDCRGKEIDFSAELSIDLKVAFYATLFGVTISVDFVDLLLCFPIPIKSFGMHTGFTFITIGWTPEGGSVIMEVDENHHL